MYEILKNIEKLKILKQHLQPTTMVLRFFLLALKHGVMLQQWKNYTFSF